MAICLSLVTGKKESAKGVLPNTIRSWAMVDPVLDTVLEVRRSGGCRPRPRRLRDIARTAAALLFPITKTRSE